MLHFVFVITIVCVASTGAEAEPDLDEDVSHRPIPCQRPRQCLTELGVHSDCVKRLCVCVNDSVYSAKGTPTCFKPQRNIGGECESTAECQMASAECRAQTCECKLGFVATKDKSGCLEDGKLLGEPCEIADQCESRYSGDVTCSRPPGSLGSKVCSCMQGDTKHDNRCYKKKSIGESCENSFNCEHIKKSTCDQLCVCEKGFVTKASNDVCLPVATEYWAQCEEDIQCSERLGDDVLCIGQHCQCKSDLGFHDMDKKCGIKKNEMAEQKDQLEETAAGETDMVPSEYPSMAKSDIPGAATIQTRISSILISTLVLMKFI